MAGVSVRERRDLDADPAAVWALVADPERIAEWAPVVFVGWMGTNLPAVGQAFFISWLTDGARRFEIDEWEAGRRFRCVVDRPAGHFEVLVDTTVVSGGPRSSLELRFAGEYGLVSSWLRASVIRMLFKRALRGAARELDES
ncbi:MAG: SRPBCC family protein [Acidimicrobiia bacterium]|nr:SRPBCC family protein [Acidimicrobiia bacterium]